VSSFFGAVSGSNPALEALETVFGQDLNGDGMIGIPSTTNMTGLERAGANSGSTTFDGTTLTLNAPSTFDGQIIGFAGDGTLSGSDQVDLRGMNYSALHADYDSSTGVLDVSDGTKTADLQFLGNYSQETFKFADDGGGGIIVYAALTSNQSATPGGVASDAAGPAVANNSPGPLSVSAGQDSFVFTPNFGQVALANFNPTTDTIQISNSVFANMSALLAATHDDPQGNAVITDAAHDTSTIQHVTTAQLLAHQSDFHFV
jgi:serralysin